MGERAVARAFLVGGLLLSGALGACSEEPQKPQEPPRPGQFLEGRYIIMGNNTTVDVGASTIRMSGGEKVGRGGQVYTPDPETWGWAYVDDKRLVIDADTTDDQPGAVCFYKYQESQLSQDKKMVSLDIERCSDETSLSLTRDDEWLHRKL